MTKRKRADPPSREFVEAIERLAYVAGTVGRDGAVYVRVPDIWNAAIPRHVLGTGGGRRDWDALTAWTNGLKKYEKGMACIEAGLDVLRREKGWIPPDGRWDTATAREHGLETGGGCYWRIPDGATRWQTVVGEDHLHRDVAAVVERLRREGHLNTQAITVWVAGDVEPWWVIPMTMGRDAGRLADILGREPHDAGLPMLCLWAGQVALAAEMEPVELWRARDGRPVSMRDLPPAPPPGYGPVPWREVRALVLAREMPKALRMGDRVGLGDLTSLCAGGLMVPLTHVLPHSAIVEDGRELTNAQMMGRAPAMAEDLARRMIATGGWAWEDDEKRYWLRRLEEGEEPPTAEPRPARLRLAL